MVYLIFPTEKPSCGLDAYSWWHEEAQRLGLDLCVLFADKIRLECDGSMIYGDAVLPLPDVAIMRGYMAELHCLLEKSGVKVFNSWQAMDLSRNKFRTHSVLTAAGLPTPRTIFPIDADAADTFLEIYRGNFIVKQNDGSQGRNIFLVTCEDEYRKAMAVCPQRMITQEYIEFSRGRDVRVWVIAGKAEAAVVRNHPGSIVSNYSQGGIVEPLKNNSKRAFDLAEEAAKVCGLDIAGVDLLFLPNGDFTICEVNANPGFRTLAALRKTSIITPILKLCL